MRLANLQRTLQAHVLGDTSGVVDEIDANDPLDASARLGIYTFAYRSRLTDALAVTFPKLQCALGTEQFAKWVGRFVLEQPSTFRSVRDYGGTLGEFLGRTIGGIKGHGLQELADFEWTLAAAFDGPDAVAITLNDLADIDPQQWPDLTLTFAPTLHRFTATSNAVKWWRTESDAPPSRWRLLTETQWAISRRDLTVYFRSLKRDETIVLDLARAGATFGALCAALSEHAIHADDSATALDAARYLHQWIQEGWIIRVEV